MRVIGPGHLLFAAGMMGLGILSLTSGDFAFQWQPVPKDMPWRDLLAYAAGALMLAGGAGMLWKRTAAIGAAIMALYQLVWVLVKLPPVIAAPLNIGVWLGVCESLAMMCGGWIIFVALAGGQGGSALQSDKAVRIARILFGLCCLVFGLSHIVYANITASMVPAWLPDRMGFAYLTGAGHFAAGVGILLMILPRLGATLEAAMMSSFVLLVHIPGVAAAPTDRFQWTMLFVAATLAGSAWSLAATLRDRSWWFARKPA